jgi:outer membrane biosynthesis protein TonB
MRLRPWIILSFAIVLAAAVEGCGAKKDAETTMADSTAFATNPTEQGQGDLAPQGQVPPPEPEPVPEPRVEKPKRSPAPTPRPKAPAPAPTPAPNPGITVPSGTVITVAVTTPISSETAQVGDTWTGVVKNNVVVGEKTVIPSGSTVSGTVSAVKSAAKGDRAMLDLAIGSMTVEGASYAANATTTAIEAGSTRARNLGAIAGTAGAGALIGGAVGGKKGALIGGLIGGVGASGAVAKSKGYQVALKEGTELTFSTSKAVNIKR